MVSALKKCKKNGITTGSISCNLNAKISKYSDYPIETLVGPEYITGSSRMKAGTAQKMILNMISTSVMIKLGKVYGNLMVDLMAVNDKLVDRGTRIIMQLTSLSYDDSLQALNNAQMSVKTALVMIIDRCDLNQARERLKKENGNLRNIIQ